MNLLERAKQIRNEQTKSYEKKITMLIEQENYDAAQYLKDKANENIGILDELMFYIERMELYNDPEYAAQSIEEIELKHKEEAAFKELTVSWNARVSQPWLFDSQEEFYKTQPPMRLMKDGSVQPINPTVKPPCQ